MQLIETAIDEQGESYIQAISQPEHWTFAKHDITEIFFTKETPLTMLSPCEDISKQNFKLNPGEIRFFRIDFSPAQGSYEALKQITENPPSFKKSFYHSTSTVDYVMVLKGPVVLIVGDKEVELQTGDCVVQRGAAHAWHNYSNEIVSIVGVMVGVEPPAHFKRINTVQP